MKTNIHRKDFYLMQDDIIIEILEKGLDDLYNYLQKIKNQEQSIDDVLSDFIKKINNKYYTLSDNENVIFLSIKQNLRKFIPHSEG